MEDPFFVLDESRRAYAAINDMFDTDDFNLLIVSAQSGFGKSHLLEEAIKAHGISDNWKANENPKICEIFWTSNRNDLITQIIANDRPAIDPATGDDDPKIIVMDCDYKNWFEKNIDLLRVFASKDPWDRYLDIPGTDGERHPLESKIIILSYANLMDLAAENEAFSEFYDGDVATVSVPTYDHKEELGYLHAIYPNIPLYLKFESKAQELKVRDIAFSLIADNLRRLKKWESLTFKFTKVANVVFFHLEDYAGNDISPLALSLALDC